MSDTFTKHYKFKIHKDGYSFIFYCDLCGTKYEAGHIKADSFEASFDQAQKEARQYFNKCHKCGKWICDKHYNKDVMQCIECSRR